MGASKQACNPLEIVIGDRDFKARAVARAFERDANAEFDEE